ncbi:unnamed protein product, partial [Oppiella nova]
MDPLIDNVMTELDALIEFYIHLKEINVKKRRQLAAKRCEFIAGFRCEIKICVEQRDLYRLNECLSGAQRRWGRLQPSNKILLAVEDNK